MSRYRTAGVDVPGGYEPYRPWEIVADFLCHKSDKFFIMLIFMIALLIRFIALGGSSLIFKGSDLTRDLGYGLIARSIIQGKGYSVPILDIQRLNNHSLTNNEDEKIPIHRTPYGLNNTKDHKHNFSKTDQYRPSANQLPFYPLFLSIFYFFSTAPFTYWIIKFLQVLISSLTCIVIYLIALRILNQSTAIIAGLLSSFYPAFIIYSIKIVPETIFTFWLSLFVLSLFILIENPSFKNIIIAGCLLGITLLNSNVVVPAIPVIILWLFISHGSWQDKFKRTLVPLSIACIFLSPWLIRNYVVFQRFPLMKSTMGLNLWIGNNPKATGTFFLPSGEQVCSVLPNVFYETRNKSEVEQDKELYKIAFTYIKENPVLTLKIFIKKFFYFFWFPPDNIITKDVVKLKKILKFPHAIFLLCFMVGFLFSLKKYYRNAILLFFIILSISLLYSIFFVGHLRFRVPIEPYMIIFASYTISLCIESFESFHAHRWKSGTPNRKTSRGVSGFEFVV